MVDIIDELRKVGGHVFERLAGGQVDGLHLERYHEALDLGLVVGVPRRLIKPVEP